MADDGQEILAAIKSPPPPPSSTSPSTVEPPQILSNKKDIDMVQTSQDTSSTLPSFSVNHQNSEEKDKPSTPSSLELTSSSTSQPVSSLITSSSPVSSTSPPPPPSSTVSSSSGLSVPNSTPMVNSSPTSTGTSVIVPSTTAKRVILTPLSSPCVQSNSLHSPNPFSPATSINRTSSPTSGHPVTLTPTSCPAISLNNHVVSAATVPNTGSPSSSAAPLLTRAVPASGYMNQVSSPLVAPAPISIPSSSNTTGLPDPKQVGNVVMSGNTVQLSKIHPQLPNGTLSTSPSTPSTVVITPSNASLPPSSAPFHPPPSSSSTINVPVATRPNIVTATPSSSSAILGPSIQSINNNTNGTSRPSTSVNPSPLRTNVPATSPMGKPTVFLTTKDGSPMILQPSTTGGPPTLVPISSANTQPISTSSGTVITFNNQTVTSMNTSSPGPRQVLVSNPNNPQMQQMILTRPGMQPTILQAPGQLRGPPMQGQQRFVLQQNAVRLPQGALRPGMPGNPVMPQRMTGFPNNFSGTFLVKTETGFQLVNLGQPGGGAPGQPQGLPQNLRFQIPQPQLPPQSAPNQQRPQHQPSQVMVTIPTSQGAIRPGTVPLNQPLSVQTPPPNSSQASTPSQMSPNTAKKKCKNFLSTLIRLASDQPEQVATNVRNLIQGLIDGQIPPEEFTNQLQRELNSSPQPCLIPFLKKSLPYLRHSLMVREMSIEGVRAPPTGSVTLPQQQQAIPQIQLTSSSVRAPMAPYGFVRMNASVPIPYPTNLVSQQQRPQMPVGIPAVSGPLLSMPSGPPTMASGVPGSMSQPQPPLPPPSLPPQPTPTKTPKKSKAKADKTPKEKAEKAPKAANNFSKIDDDDINDVAAMGGVNLQEEHQRMAASANEVGTQIRSCKDENFLFTSNLSSRINEISRRFCIPEDAPPDVVSIVSHAAQEYLKTVVEKLGVIAEHRLENFKMNPKYEPTQDVRAQVKFLEELDRMEKKRHEEQEREMLLRAAKSRSKLEDPEQVKLKQKAKEMQRAELEEARQREANETALQAIGFRKKPRLDMNASTSSTSSFNTSSTNPFASPFGMTSTKTPIRRMKRVCMRDVLFLMEQERMTSKSPFLYKAYNK